jgi:hypothetical protein
MKLRITSTVLWTLAGWAVAGAFATFFGVSPLIGPFVGAVWGAFVLIDPKHVLWSGRDAGGLRPHEAAGQRAES